MLLKGKTVFVTGANGFVGSFLVERLLKEGALVKCLVRKTGNLRWLKGFNIDFIYGDITDAKSFRGKLKNVDFIFHIAALKHSTRKNDYKRINIDATENILIARKKEAENLVLEYKNIFPVTIIRPPAVYGPRDEDILAMFKAIKAGIRPVFGIQKKYLSMVFVLDLVEALLLSALSKKASGKIYIIAEDKHYSWKEIQDVVAGILEVKAITLKIPKTILFGAALIAELFSGVTGVNVLLTTHKVRELTGDWVCNIGRAKKDLGFKPLYDINKGMQLTAKWYKENNWL